MRDRRQPPLLWSLCGTLPSAWLGHWDAELEPKQLREFCSGSGSSGIRPCRISHLCLAKAWETSRPGLVPVPEEPEGECKANAGKRSTPEWPLCKIAACDMRFELLFIDDLEGAGTLKAAGGRCEDPAAGGHSPCSFA